MSTSTIVALGVGAVLAAWLLVTTLTARPPALMLSTLSILAVSPSVFSFDLDWAQKAVVAVVLILVALRKGVARHAAPVAAAVVFTLSLLFALLPSHDLITAPSTTAVRAYAGYLLPWLFLLIRWDRREAQSLLRGVQYLSVLTIPFGIVLQAAGLWQVVPSDGTSLRLAGASIPATLALSAVVGVLAAALELVLFDTPKHATAWLVVNLVVVAGTLTRGALIAATVIVLGLGLWSLTGSSRTRPAARRAARRLVGLLVVLVAAALPNLLARSAGNSYEGAFNTSGREQAWPFYLQMIEASPWIGRGLGFATIAIGIYAPVGVQQLTAPHNEYLHLATDGGVLLLVGFLVVLAIAFRSAIRAAGPGSGIVMGAGLVATLVYALSDNPFSTPQFMVPFAVVLSALLAMRAREPDAAVREDGAGPAREPVRAGSAKEGR